MSVQREYKKKNSSKQKKGEEYGKKRVIEKSH
jgi:hypothetical protein